MRIVKEGDLKPQRKYLIWVEQRRSYRDVKEFLSRTGLKRAEFFVANSVHALKLAQELGEDDPAKAALVRPFSAIDPAIDEDLYGASLACASWYARILTRALAPLKVPGLDEKISTPFMLALAAHLASELRPLFALVNLVSKAQGVPVLVLPGKPSALPLIIDAIEPDVTARFYRVEGFGDDAVEPRSGSALVDVYPPGILAFPPDEIARVMAKADVALVSHVSDSLYRVFCEQVLPPLCTRKTVALFTVTPGPLEELHSSPLRRLIDDGVLTLTHAERRGVVELPDRVVAAVDRSIAALLSHPPSLKRPAGVRKLEAIAAKVVSRHVLSLLDAAGAMSSAFRVSLSSIEAVAVCPGRYLGASVLVEAAKSAGVPTVEIQGGIIGRTKRYFPPSADHVVAIDPESAAIYRELLGVPADRVTIVGSAKIDLSTEPARRLSREEARQRASLDHLDLGGRPLVLFASQPIGLERAKVLFEAVLTGVAQAGISHLVVKTHPREGAEYAELYERLGKALGTVTVILAAPVDVHYFFVAVDIALTYYSTVGVEAFALGRPVVAVNPFAEPPAFDLAALGVAMSARTGAQLADCLRQIEEAGLGQFYVSDPKLSLLTDGGATDRVVQFVLDMAARVGSSR